MSTCSYLPPPLPPRPDTVSPTLPPGSVTSCMPPTVLRLINSHWLRLPSRSLNLRFGAFDQGPSPYRIRRAFREQDREAPQEVIAGGDGAKKEAVEVERKRREVEEVANKEKERQKQKRKEEKVVIQGVEIPRRPAPPGPEECCMSGCAHCVYDLYADDLTEYKSLLTSARIQLISKNVPSSLWPPDIRPPARPKLSPKSLSAADSPQEVDRFGEVRESAEDEVDEVIKGLDPTMKAFLMMERKLKKKKREKERQAAKVEKEKETSSASSSASASASV